MMRLSASLALAVTIWSVAVVSAADTASAATAIEYGLIFGFP